MSKDYKSPPILSKDCNYNTWKKELKIWEAFTSLPEGKRAPAVFMTLTGEAKEAVLNLEISSLTGDDGMENLIKELDNLYLKDESSLAYEAYETFEKFIRPHNMSISDYVIKFEQLYQKAKSFKMEILDGVLAYRLLNSANLSDTQRQLVKATVNKMEYVIMKDQLKKIFTNINLLNKNELKSEDDIKIERDSFYVKKSFEGASNAYRNNRYRQNPQHKNSDFKRKGFSASSERQNTNATDNKGNILTCNVCGSIFHFANKCPDKHRIRPGSYFVQEEQDDI